MVWGGGRKGERREGELGVARPETVDFGLPSLLEGAEIEWKQRILRSATCFLCLLGFEGLAGAGVGFVK